MGEIEECIVSALPEVLSKVLGVDKDYVASMINTGKIRVTPTPDPSLGDYGVAVHAVLRSVDRSKWSEVGNAIARELYLATREKCWVERVDFLNGYVNITVNYSSLLARLVEAFIARKVFIELSDVGKGLRVVVEHTSANPVHPLHVGSGRNSVLGDTYARLLRKLGFSVQTRFYVNDLGRQMATLVYGVRIVESRGLSKPSHLKPDHWYGVIYALTNILIELSKLREELRRKLDAFVVFAESACREVFQGQSVVSAGRELELLLCEIAWKKTLKLELLKYVKAIHSILEKESSKYSRIPVDVLKLLEEIKGILEEYREFLVAERRLATYYPELHAVLRSAIRDYRESEEEIRNLMQLAERGDEKTVAKFREIAEQVIGGFKETLERLGIVFDGFDYESSDVILGTARKVVEELMKTGYARIVEGGAVEVDLNSAARDHKYVKDLFYPDQAGRFIVQRSDGTTLYVTRDIAYTLYKFRSVGASRIYNVIAVEQAREQKQLKAVLYILGLREEAENLHHFAYEMVHLKGMRMSGRRGIYYTIDEALVDAKLRILRKLVEKESTLQLSELINLAGKLAVANLRTLLLSVDPGKVLVFDQDKLGETEYGTIVEYAFVRAQGVIRNLWGVEFLDDPERVYSMASEIAKSIGKVELTLEEKRLAELLTRFKDALLEAYREMKPNKLLEYAVNLSLEFNKFYEKYPIIGERDPVKKNTRILITVLVLLALSELMDIMGIPKLRKM